MLSVIDVVLFVKLDFVIFLRPAVSSSVKVLGFCSWAKESGISFCWLLPTCWGELLIEVVPLLPPAVPMLLEEEPEPDRLRLSTWASPIASDVFKLHCCCTRSGRLEEVESTTLPESTSLLVPSLFELVALESLQVSVCAEDTLILVKSSDGFLWCVLSPGFGNLSPKEALLVRIPPET